MSVQIIGLSNGDKLIGEIGRYDLDGNYVQFDSNNDLIIKDGLILKEVMTQEGYSLIPLPLVPSDDKEIKINSAHIIIRPCTPKKEVLDMYKQMTSSILLPKSSGGLKLV